jgi:hypothetical protein
MDDRLISGDDRTNRLLNLFNFGKSKDLIFNGLNWEVIRDIKLNEFDSWRLFNYFQDLFSILNKEDSSYMNLYIEKCINFKELMQKYKDEIKMFVFREATLKKFLQDLELPKNIKEELKAPFNKLFLDVDIKINDDIKIFGILGIFYDRKLIKELRKLIKELNDLAGKEINTKLIDDSNNVMALRFLCCENKNGEPTFYFHDFAFNLREGRPSQRAVIKFKDHKGDEVDEQYKTELIEKVVSSFMTNLLLFFNEPRVVTYIFDRPHRNRERKGLIPIPSEIRTRIDTELNNYIETVCFNGESHSKLGYAFWVMGHWRTFHSDYYINKKGEKIWIPAHIRGEGLIPPQVFEMTK